VVMPSGKYMYLKQVEAVPTKMRLTRIAAEAQKAAAAAATEAAGGGGGERKRKHDVDSTAH